METFRDLLEKITKSGVTNEFGYLEIEGSKHKARVVYSLAMLQKNTIELDVNGEKKIRKLTNLKNINRQLNDLLGKFDMSNPNYIKFLQMMPCSN